MVVVWVVWKLWAGGENDRCSSRPQVSQSQRRATVERSPWKISALAPAGREGNTDGQGSLRSGEGNV